MWPLSALTVKRVLITALLFPRRLTFIFFFPGALCDQVLDKSCLEPDTSVRAECFFLLFFVSNNTVTLCPVFWGLASDCESSSILYRHLVPGREFLDFFFFLSFHMPQTPSYLEGIIL